MPFRASFYQHFGYGLCERRSVWDIPTAILPRTRSDTGFLLIDPADDTTLKAVADCRLRQAKKTHGDLWFSQKYLPPFGHWVRHFNERGYLFARPARDGRVDAFVGTVPLDNPPRVGLSAFFLGCDDPSAFLDLLRFLGTLRDQYGLIQLATPADFPLNELLLESQVPHRPVEHPHATCRTIARMQVRVLDHPALLNTAPWPDPSARGRVVVAVKETEGHESRFVLDVADGHAEAKATDASPHFTCPDHVWASIALGEMSARFAAEHGLAESSDAGAIDLLSTLRTGPLPFCREYF